MASGKVPKAQERIIQLRKRGIKAKGDFGPTEVDTNGLAWILNYLYETGSGVKAIDSLLFDALIQWRTSVLRELRLIATYLPTWSGDMHFRPMAYLSATPMQRSIVDFPVTESIGKVLTIRGRGMETFHYGACPFKVDYYEGFQVHLSEEEAEALREGGMLRISPKLTDGETIM